MLSNKEDLELFHNDRNKSSNVTLDKMNVEIILHKHTATVTVTQVFRNNSAKPIKIGSNCSGIEQKNLRSCTVQIDGEKMYETDSCYKDGIVIDSGSLNPSQTCTSIMVYLMHLRPIKESTFELIISKTIMSSVIVSLEGIQFNPCMIELCYTVDGVNKLHQQRNVSSKEDIVIKIESSGGITEKSEEVSPVILTTNTVGQPFDYYCVLDFEAVCHQINPKLTRIAPDDIWEVIEFPICLLESQTNRIIDIYHSYVRPTIRTKLNEKCIEITGITQETVDRSPTFDIVWKKVQTFLAKHSLIPSEENPSILHSFTWIICGNWDLKTMLPLQLNHCGLHQPSFVKSFINLKDLYNEYYPSSQVRGMKDMLRKSNLKLEGRHHSGIDDTKNVAQVAQWFINKKNVLKLTYKNIEINRKKYLNIKYEERIFYFILSSFFCFSL